MHTFVQVLLLLAAAAGIAAAAPFDANTRELLQGQKGAGASATAQASLLEAQAGTDLASTIASLLTKETQAHQDNFKALFLEQEQNASLESALAKQQAQVRERAVFLERLQSCMTEGSTANVVLMQREQQLQQQAAALDAQAAAVERQRKDAALKEASFVAREELAHRKQTALADAAAKEAAARASLAETATQLKQQAAQLKASETDLLRRFAAVDSREADLMRREAAVRKRLAEVEMQTERATVTFAETAAAVELAATGADACAAAADCASCTKLAACAWCASAAPDASNSTSTTATAEIAGTCLPHDVNAPSDGLTSGQCPVRNWMSKVGDRLTLLSLNVFGGDAAGGDERAEAIFNTIIAAQYPDVVALQEVAPWFEEKLLAQPWVRQYYHHTSFGANAAAAASSTEAAAPATLAPGGLLTLSRFPVVSTRYADQQAPSYAGVDERPRLLTAAIDYNGKRLVVANAHLDWRSAATRVEGLKFLHGLTQAEENVLLAGDFNFDEGAQPETSAVPQSWSDLWSKLRGSETPDKVTRGPNRFGFTYDPASNWYARYSDQTSQPTRVDRVFARTTVLLAREINLVGCPGPDYLCTAAPGASVADSDRMLPYQQRANQVQGNVVHPSSHYGLLASFSTFVPHC